VELLREIDEEEDLESYEDLESDEEDLYLSPLSQSFSAPTSPVLPGSLPFVAMSAGSNFAMAPNYSTTEDCVHLTSYNAYTSAVTLFNSSALALASACGACCKATLSAQPDSLVGTSGGQPACPPPMHTQKQAHHLHHHGPMLFPPTLIGLSVGSAEQQAMFFAGIRTYLCHIHKNRT
jgi:hypothetical protein